MNAATETIAITIDEDDLMSGSPVRAALRRAAGPILVPDANSGGIYLCTDARKPLWAAPWPEDLKAFLARFHAGEPLPVPSREFTLTFQRTPSASDHDIAMYGGPDAGQETGS